ncbi:FecR domain-containing protein [Chitinophaga niabensis]|uniref:FecR domain-containing protein n=1 Tax=Chitinophaga niabensis TaxID=536979 RepID=UPI0031BBB35C
MENLNPFEKADLLYRYLRDELREEERTMVEDWLAADEDNQKLIDQFRDQLALDKEMALFSSGDKSKAWELIAARTGNTNKRKKVLWSAAAVALLCLAGGWLIWQPPGAIKQDTVVQKKNTPLNINKTRLTLADGSVIALDETDDGALYEDGSAKLTKKNGELLYQGKEDDKGALAGYNMVHTPVGGQYRIVLPDKSKVWLNATSSLRYPTAFHDSVRVVELSGEAYFEVAKNKSMPFIVKAGETKVEVVGTHFNIMAYPDEQTTRTTLLEGAVIVSKGREKQKMKPGQEAVAGDGIRLLEADLQAAVAWKQGFSHFENAGIGMVMRQLVRWYDIEVVYEKGMVPDIHFSGIISKNSSVEQVIAMLNASGNLHMEVQGRKVLVKAVK